MDAITTTLPAFMEHLAALAGGIEAALGNGAEADLAGQAPEGDPTVVPDIAPFLRDLAQALQARNAPAIDPLLEELYRKPLDGKTREALDAVSGDVLMAEYGKAEETVAALLENKTGV